jgi:polysaccharide export outer membrane protein
MLVEKPGTVDKCGRIVVFVLSLCLFWLTGCGPVLSTSEQVEMFGQAGPVVTGVEINGSETSSKHIGPYRVIPGDILAFQMPAVLRVISSNLSEWLRPVYGHQDVESYLARVSETGVITLPIIGEIAVAGKTLAEIESLVISSYYPKYVVRPPMVVCEVSKYRSENERVFTVMGLVNHPDAFPYPPDVQYNLMEALAFAGGLDMVADPRYLKIYRQKADGGIVSATFGVDSKSLAEAYSVLVKPGDVIYVDHTLRTRANQFLAEVLQIRVGADVRRTSD